MSARVRRVLLWTAGALAVANLVAFFAYTAPQAARKRDVAARTAALDSELSRQRAQVKDLNDRAEAITANRKESRAFLEGQVAAADASVVPVLTEVESLARKQGLRVGRQAFSWEPVKGLPVERFGITMPVMGNYRQVTGLLGDLEASSTFVTLDRVSAGAQGEAAEVALDLEFSFYFRRGARR